MASTSSVMDKYVFKDDYVNPRGIPKVDFIENVAELVKASGNSTDHLLRRFAEQHSKIKLSEHTLVRSIANLEAKLPEIRKTLETLQFLKTQLAEHQESKDDNDEEEAGLKTNYGLTESTFCQAYIPPQESVHLWLGANVMVEYSFDEAINMLNRNQESAKENLKRTQEDLSWLQEQRTILEVNTSRVYNYGVIERRKEKSMGNES